MTEIPPMYGTPHYFMSDEDVARYLDKVMAEAGEDPGVLLRALSEISRMSNKTQLAKNAGLTRAGLYKALAATGNPRIATLHRIAKAMGLKVILVPDEGRSRPAPDAEAPPAN